MQGVALDVGTAAAVEVIPSQRTAGMCQMDTDLVGASGFQPHPDQRPVPWPPFQDPPEMFSQSISSRTNPGRAGGLQHVIFMQCDWWVPTPLFICTKNSQIAKSVSLL